MAISKKSLMLLRGRCACSRLTVSLVFTFSTVTLWARPAHYPAPADNLREQCRKELAGIFLKALDELNVSRDQQQLYQAKLQALQADQVKAKKEFADRSEAVRKSDYEVELARNKDHARTHLQAVEEALAQTKDLVEKSKQGMSMTESHLAKMRKSYEEVFVFERPSPTPAGAYPYRIEYKTSCPKYRYLCSLPSEEATALSRILGGDTPESCIRYSQLAAPKR
jgi:hypothetical protein